MFLILLKLAIQIQNIYHRNYFCPLSKHLKGPTNALCLQEYDILQFCSWLQTES